MDMSFRPPREPRRLSSELVCRAVGLELGIFNRLVQKHPLPFPKVRNAGSGGRIWKDKDLLNVFVLARLVELGTKHQDTCTLVNEFDRAMQIETNKHTRHMLLIKGYNDFAFFWPDRYKDEATGKIMPAFISDDKDSKMFNSPLGDKSMARRIGPVLWTLEFFLPNIRELIVSNVSRELDRVKSMKNRLP